MRIIAGTARSRVIEAPRGTDTRPTLDRVRENLFNVLRREVPGAQVLDLFAGSGALALEALSRGAGSAVLVDSQRAAQEAEARNVQALGFGDRARLLRMDWRRAVQLLTAEGARFDLVFLDPPYALHDLTEVTGALLPLLAEDALVCVEHPAREPSAVSAALSLCDRRQWGYVGVSLYRKGEEDGGNMPDPGQL